jgi:hypothetical protein
MMLMCGLARGLILLLLTVVGAPVLARAQTAPALGVVPVSAAPGEMVTLRGSGWPASSTLVARLSEDTTSGAASASLGGPIAVGENGAFAVTATVPRTLFGQGSRGNLNVVPGPYAVVVNQDTRVTASTTLTVDAPRDAGLVWGEVTLDVDGNDAHDARDQAAAALVTMTASSGAASQALTDARGHFVLSPVIAGAYHLEARAEVQNDVWTTSADAVVANGQVARVDLLLRPPRPSGLPASLVAIQGSTLFVAAHDRLVTFDLSNARHPTLLGQSAPLGADIRNLSVSGARAAILLQQQGVRLVDVSEPRQPRVAGSYPTPASSANVALMGGSLLLAPEGDQLSVLDVSTPEQPTGVGKYQANTELRSVTAAGRYAYVVTTDSSLRIVDLSNPMQPVQVGAISIEGAGYLSPVAVTHGNAFGTFIFGHYTQSIVIDVSDSTRPARRTDVSGNLYTTDEAFAPQGDLLYVANPGVTGFGSVGVVAIGNPSAPSLVYSLEARWDPLGIAVRGSWAYALGRDDLLHVLDIGTPPALRQVALVPLAPVPAAPPVVHDERYFPETGYRIDDDAVWDYFLQRGDINTFGYPVSRQFTFLGCSVQMFQREIAQRCADGNVQLMNVLDPELFPYTRVNFSTFPAADDRLKAATPKVDQPDYGSSILEFVAANAPDDWQGQPVRFGATFLSLITPEIAGTDDPAILGLLNLELWGAPISEPAADPNNPSFVYQRFQRGIMHFDAASGVTRGILVADYLKAILRGVDLPPDLAEQAAASSMFAQYCPGVPAWVCRADELPGSDLTFAFEIG